MALLTPANFIAKWLARFADNTVGEIGEDDLREFAQDLNDSIASKADASAVTNGLNGKLDMAGGTMSGILGLEKQATADNPHISLKNPDAPQDPAFNNEQRAELFMDADGVVKLRNLTGKGFLIRNGSNVSTLFRVYEDGRAEVFGKEIATKDLSIRTLTASGTLELADRGGLVRMNVASANTLTVPPNSAVPLPVGTQLVVTQAGAGQTTIVEGSGVTINASGGKKKLTGQYSGATLVKIRNKDAAVPGDTDQWTLMGDLSA